MEHHDDDDNANGGGSFNRNDRYGNPEPIEPTRIQKTGNSFWTELIRDAWEAAGNAAKGFASGEEVPNQGPRSTEGGGRAGQGAQTDPVFTFEDGSTSGGGFFEALIKSVLLAIAGSILGTLCRMLMRLVREFLWREAAVA